MRTLLSQAYQPAGYPSTLSAVLSIKWKHTGEVLQKRYSGNYGRFHVRVSRRYRVVFLILFSTIATVLSTILAISGMLYPSK